MPEVRIGLETRPYALPALAYMLTAMSEELAGQHENLSYQRQVCANLVQAWRSHCQLIHVGVATAKKPACIVNLYYLKVCL